MDHPLRLNRIETAQQWRTATLLVAGVAVAELVVLLVLGGALLVKPPDPTDVLRTRPESAQNAKPAAAVVKADKSSAAKPSVAKPASAAAADLPRRKVAILVLNGNGKQGAAAAAASRATSRGYRVKAVANAPSHDYVHSIVLYRPGFKAEGRRLARDLGVPIVSPLDGMRPSQLQGAHAVLILGS